MIVESTVVGAIVGAVSRLTPEAMRYLDRHLDRRHEIAMQDKALEFERIRPAGQKSMELAMTGSEAAATLDALKEAWRQQFQTGDKRLDTVSILVRPGVTYALLVTYILALLFGLRAYGEEDLALFSGILSFWYLDRQMWKSKGGT